MASRASSLVGAMKASTRDRRAPRDEFVLHAEIMRRDAKKIGDQACAWMRDVLSCGKANGVALLGSQLAKRFAPGEEQQLRVIPPRGYRPSSTWITESSFPAHRGRVVAGRGEDA